MSWGRGRLRPTPCAIIAPVTPPVLALAGVLMLLAGWALMRSLGPRVRVGRILASTPIVPVATAALVAGRPRYLGVRGRVDADDPFEDADHRPLVYRRTRLEAERRPGHWVALEDHVERVPFEIHEGLDAVGVDVAALGDGVVVIARESVGTAADVPDRVPADLPPATPVRLRVEQISSVDHAIVLGVPARRPDGAVVLAPGLGRPLVVTTLEPREAIRLVGGGRRGRTVAAVVALAGGAALVVLGLAMALVAVVTAVVDPPVLLAATPEPTAVPAGDPRSPGQGPGLVGDPAFAIGAVLAIAVVTVAVTGAWVRLTGRGTGDGERRSSERT